MFPTAVSEVTEQVVKVGFGLLFAYLFRDDIIKAVVFLLLAVSLSELATLLLMMAFYKGAKKEQKIQNEGGRVAMKSILKLSIPVTFNSILLPLSGLLDSVLVPKMLGLYAADAVTLYGLFAGGAVTVINLPVSVCYGIAAASVPRVAMATGEEGNSPRKRILYSLGITALIGAASTTVLYFFAEPTAKIIFRLLKNAEKQYPIREAGGSLLRTEDFSRDFIPMRYWKNTKNLQANNLQERLIFWSTAYSFCRM